MAKAKDIEIQKKNVVHFEDVRDKIFTLRDQKVILDFAVAELYGVETREINQAVKNNPGKFPEGWTFELTKTELEDLQSKILTTNLPNPKSRVSPKAYYKKKKINNHY